MVRTRISALTAKQRPIGRTSAMLLTAAVAALVVFVPGAASVSERTVAWCDPIAYTPIVYGDNTGRSHGKVQCPFGEEYSFQWAQRLYNNSGGILWNSGLHQAQYNSLEIWGETVGCAGAIVKTWQYANNYFGTDPASDTSGTNSDCSY